MYAIVFFTEDNSRMPFAAIKIYFNPSFEKRDLLDKICDNSMHLIHFTDHNNYT